jgi:hypothetical protein
VKFCVGVCHKCNVALHINGFHVLIIKMGTVLKVWYLLGKFNKVRMGTRGNYEVKMTVQFFFSVVSLHVMLVPVGSCECFV